MLSQNDFQVQIKRIKRLLWVKQCLITSINTGAIFLIFYLILMGVQYLPISMIRKTHNLYPYLLLLAIAISFLFSWIKGEKLQTSLINLDQHFGYKDCLSSAYEKYQHDKKSPFFPYLIHHAVGYLQKLKLKHIIPMQVVSVQLWLIGILTLFILLFMILPIPGLRSQSISHQKVVHTMNQTIENYIQKKDKKISHNMEKHKKKYFDEIHRLVKSYHQRALPNPVFKQKMGSLLDEISSDQKKWHAELGKQLENYNLQGVGGAPAVNQMLLAIGDLDKLREAMNKVFKDGIPEPLNNLLEKMESSQELKNLVQGLTNTAISEKDASENSSDALTKGDKQSDPNDQSLADQANNVANETGKGRDNSEIKSNKNDPSQSGNANDADADGQGTGSYSVGKGKGKSDKPTSPLSFNKNNGPVYNDRTASAPAKTYNMHIRSLTEIGTARTPEEEITRVYRREVESILEKEELPRNYRHYIKNYFLSIGYRGK